MQFWSQYGLFLAKTFTFVIALLLLLVGVIALTRKDKATAGKLEVKNINERFDEFAETLRDAILTKSEHKKLAKAKKAQAKAKKSEQSSQDNKRIYVLNFSGDMKASSVSSLREEISAVLRVATQKDEIVVCLESPGGLVANYGLAASQLRRVREQKIPLTVIVDKVAASGGYMMACVADRILAAPFAIIGSIGVVAQLPNFHRFLKKQDIDFEQLTAGQYKRTLTLFGENTEKAREKMQEEIEEIHTLFKNFIQQNRPQVDMAQIATGEHWLGTKALDLKLVDALTTSDDYLLTNSANADIYQVTYTTKKSMVEKLSATFSSLTSVFHEIKLL